MTIADAVMCTRLSRMQRAQLIVLIFIAGFLVYRYTSDQSATSLIIAACRDTSSSPKTDSHTSTLGDGAFYRAAEQATRDEDWEEKMCPLRELNDLDELFEYIYTPRASCDTQMMLGGRLRGSLIDGDKWICYDKKYNIIPANCLVFSFGIGSDWSFEDDVEAKLGCKVYAFDPTTEQQTHNRTALISFFSLGISDAKATKPTDKIKMDRYVNILRSLGHVDSTIDILKMDVEGYELRFFKDVFEHMPNMLKNVKMIAMEVHLGHEVEEIHKTHRAFWKYFQVLDCFGFKIWHTAHNLITPGRVINGRHRTCCYEVVWVQDRQW